MVVLPAAYAPPVHRSRRLHRRTGLRQRMQLRMALHALSILLPRPGSLDRLDPGRFAAALEDFRAAVNVQENPQEDQV